MEARGGPYIATVSPAYPVDLYDKFVKAKKIKGTRSIHRPYAVPAGLGVCTRGKPVKNRAASPFETCIAPLFEIENGKLRPQRPKQNDRTEKASKLPMINYREKQGRLQEDEPWANFPVAALGGCKMGGVRRQIR